MTEIFSVDLGPEEHTIPVETIMTLKLVLV